MRFMYWEATVNKMGDWENKVTKRIQAGWQNIKKKKKVSGALHGRYSILVKLKGCFYRAVARVAML